MSKLTAAHHGIARWLRSRIGDDVEVNASVERYHRTDGYRNVTVSAADVGMLDGLYRGLLDHVQVYDGERLRITVDEPQRTAKPGTFAFYVSIWPTNRS